LCLHKKKKTPRSYTLPTPIFQRNANIISSYFRGGLLFLVTPYAQAKKNHPTPLPLSLARERGTKTKKRKKKLSTVSVCTKKKKNIK